jgi:3-oxoacyl-[acyl-carrier protein] reductase
MYSAIDMIKRSIDGMTERGFGRIVNITSVAVKLPQAELGLSNGARAGLTGFIAGIARGSAQHNVTINNLLPGFIDTDRMRNVVKAKADAAGVEVDQFSDAFFDNMPSKRPGEADEFGSTCTFLCSQQAAYITAQNLLVDGGLYPGTF